MRYQKSISKASVSSHNSPRPFAVSELKWILSEMRGSSQWMWLCGWGWPPGMFIHFFLLLVLVCVWRGVTFPFSSLSFTSLLRIFLGRQLLFAWYVTALQKMWVWTHVSCQCTFASLLVCTHVFVCLCNKLNRTDRNMTLTICHFALIFFGSVTVTVLMLCWGAVVSWDFIWNGSRK